jgi:hypothetical protein
MKIKIKTTTEKEIELPKYFKVGNSYNMLIDNGSCMRLYYNPIFVELDLYPKIELMSTDSLKHYIHFDDKIIPISETEFKTEFLKISVLLEELMN